MICDEEKWTILSNRDNVWFHEHKKLFKSMVRSLNEKGEISDELDIITDFYVASSDKEFYSKTGLIVSLLNYTRDLFKCFKNNDTKVVFDNFIYQEFIPVCIADNRAFNKIEKRFISYMLANRVEGIRTNPSSFGLEAYLKNNNNHTDHQKVYKFCNHIISLLGFTVFEDVDGETSLYIDALKEADGYGDNGIDSKFKYDDRLKKIKKSFDSYARKAFYDVIDNYVKKITILNGGDI